MLPFKHIISILSFVLVISTNAVQAQIAPKDSTKLNNTILRKKAPKKATLLSLVLPGSGQIYNGKYWKAPIAWAGLIGLASLAILNHSKYNINNNLIKTLNADTTGKVFTPKTDPDSQAKLSEYSSNADFYRRNRDLSWVGFGALYVYQVVDACVDAHLSEFDMGDNLSLKVSPYFKGNITTYHSGISLTLRFKN
jgi:hypothetical protein